MRVLRTSRRNLLSVALLTGLSEQILLRPTRPERYAIAAQEGTPESGRQPGINDAPVPVTFPRDDGPHSAFIEWWYYTGHLFTEAGHGYGFEFVVFKGERNGMPFGYASHFAVTDNLRGKFVYDERIAPINPADSTSTEDAVFDLQVGDWRMWGGDGDDRLLASMPGFAMALRLSPDKAPALHDGDGYIDYGDGQASYYYSRTRMGIAGSLAVDGVTLPVTGDAWMDHQWGDFNTFEDGGWDWFSLQLDDGSDLMLYVITTVDGTPRIVDGSLVAPDGALTVLDGDDFSIEPNGTWTSPHTGITYPSSWTISLSAEQLAVTVTPSLPDQELDTTASTGVVYWEGEVTVSGTRAGVPIAGLGYVELTGYGNRDLAPS